MRMKNRKHQSSHTNCHPLLSETRRISNAEIAAGYFFWAQMDNVDIGWLSCFMQVSWGWGVECPGETGDLQNLRRKLQHFWAGCSQHDICFSSSCVPQTQQSAGTPTVRSSTWVQNRHIGHMLTVIFIQFCRDHSQVMRVRKPSSWTTKPKLLK